MQPKRYIFETLASQGITAWVIERLLFEDDEFLEKPENAINN